VDARDDDRGEHKVGCVLTLTKRSPVAHPLLTSITPCFGTYCGSYILG